MIRILLLLLLLPLFTWAQVINTIAGCSLYTTSGDGGLATAAGIAWPCGIAFDGKGNFYFVDNNSVRKVDTAGIITTIAGNGGVGYSGDSSFAIDAEFNGPQGLAIDKTGNLYIADQNNHVVRKVDTSGIITTFAGNFAGGPYGAYWGPADSGGMIWPTGLAFDTSGNLYVADLAGNIAIVNMATDSIMSVSMVIHDTLYALGVPDITGIAVAGNGDIYFTGESYSAVYKVSVRGVNIADNWGFVDSGAVSIVAGSGVEGVFGDSGDGGPATGALLVFPFSLALDKQRNLYIGDGYIPRIRVVDTNGYIYTIAGSGAMGTEGFSGDGGPAIMAQLADIGMSQSFIALDTAGSLYISDNGNSRVRKVTSPMSLPLRTNFQTVPESSISLFPNPTHDKLTIQSTVQPINELTITNIVGQTVYSQQPTTNGKLLRVDVSDLPKGIYFVKVNGADVRKFVKQ